MTTAARPFVQEAAGRPGVQDELAMLFAAHYASLVRLAALLLKDPGHREEAAAYPRQTVVNLSRSRLRRRLVAARLPVHHQPDARSAEEVTLDRLERSDLQKALRSLPPRQRQAVVLRHYAGLSEAETAEAMGTGIGAVKSNASRGVTALRKAMEER